MDNNSIGDLVTAMTKAAVGSLGTSAAEVAATAKSEFEKIAQTVQTISAKFATGDLTPAGATILFEMQKTSASSALLELEGMSELAVQNAINAALDIAKDGFNKIVGFSLIA